MTEHDEHDDVPKSEHDEHPMEQEDQSLEEDSGDAALEGVDAPEAGEGASVEVEEDEAGEAVAPHEEVDEGALVDFDEVRSRVQEIIEAGEHAQADLILRQFVRWPDSTRHLEDNLWLYRTAGDVSRAEGDHDRALEAYEHAFLLDPRELEVLRPYSELLFVHERVNDGLRVLQSLLLYHKRKLSLEELVSVYHRLGTCYEALEQYDKAKSAYEKALEQSQQDADALEGLLRVVSLADTPHEIIRVRQRLIRSLQEPSARAMAMIKLGDDWIERFNDPMRALDTYEQAILEDPANLRALERIAHIAMEMEDWRRVSRSYFTMSRLVEDPVEQAEWLIKASFIARERLWEADKALAGFQHALALDPTRTDAFQAVTSILVDSKNWLALRDAYVNFINAVSQAGSQDVKLLAVLLQRLGDLSRIQLDNFDDAIVAYDQAVQLVPHDMELREKIVALSERNPEYYDKAAEHLAFMRQLTPDDPVLLTRIGMLAMRRKEIDQAFCIFRSLDYAGVELEAKPKRFVQQLSMSKYRAPASGLSLKMMSSHVFDPQLDWRISKVFSIINPVLEEYLGESRSKYGLRRRDRVRVEEQLVFNNIYRSIGGALGYGDQLPELWRRPEQLGLINGALIPKGLIAGDDLLGRTNEKMISFVVAKQLFLFLNPFYLAAIRPLDELQGVFMLALALAEPGKFPNIPTNNDVFKLMSKKIRGEQLDRLRKAVQVLTAQEQGVDLGMWLERVEDSSNRVGFIFCDDLATCEQYLDTEPQRISQRTVTARMQSLVEYSLSSTYAELRAELGLTISSK